MYATADVCLYNIVWGDEALERSVSSLRPTTTLNIYVVMSREFPTLEALMALTVHLQLRQETQSSMI